eukprot:c3218_g2_i1 orf=101-592(-)
MLPLRDSWRRFSCHNNGHELLLQLTLLLVWMHIMSLSVVGAVATTADLQGADGSSEQKLLSQLMGASGCRALRDVYSPMSTSNLGQLMQGWCSHYWRSMLSVGDTQEKTDYLGDYTPSPNVDRGVAAPFPSPIHVQTIVGNKRKLLQDYSPMANTNPGPAAGS